MSRHRQIRRAYDIQVAQSLFKIHEQIRTRPCRLAQEQERNQDRKERIRYFSTRNDNFQAGSGGRSRRVPEGPPEAEAKAKADEAEAREMARLPPKPAVSPKRNDDRKQAQREAKPRRKLRPKNVNAHG